LNSSDVLARWALLGLVVLLCAPWAMPSNKLYHQALILFMWLPALISLGFSQLRPKLPRLDIILLSAFASWTLLVIAINGGGEPVSQAKVVLYVGLSLVAMLLAARAAHSAVESVVMLAALVAGLGSLVSWIDFYVLTEHSYRHRVLAVGIWDTVIMAAHAVGALAVLGVGLVLKQPKTWRRSAIVVFVVGACALFLLSSQTRGVWLGVAGVMALALLSLPWRVRIAVTVAAAATLATIIWLDAYLLLQRGLSYRPELWRAGVALLMESPFWGLGFHDFKLAVPGLKTLYNHPHNLFIDTGIRLGLIGLLLFLCVWVRCAFLAWQARGEALGRALLMLWVFSSLSLMTDGIGLWLKPNADWMITWLPIGLGLVLAQRSRYAEAEEHIGVQHIA